MIHAFVFDEIAVLVGPWHEPMDPPEHGVRVEVRLRADEPQRGSRFAAQRLSIDQPVFRADLFDEVDGPPANLAKAHFHSGFDGVEPRIREWPSRVREDPLGWLADELSDLPAMFARAGVDASSADADAVRAAIPEVCAAVEATWADVRNPAPRQSAP
jgi:hypothetical protein